VATDNDHLDSQADTQPCVDCNDSPRIGQVNDWDAALVRNAGEILSALLCVCPSAVIITDETATILHVNQGFTRLTGYDIQDVVGKPITTLDGGNKHEQGHQQVREIIRAGVPWTGECCGKNKFGETYWSSRTIYPIHDSRNVVTTVIFVEEDVTERKLVEGRLIQAQKMESLGYLVASVTHDFNNLLLAMLGFTALLEARLDPTGEAYEYSTMIESLAHKGVELSRQLLTSGRKDFDQSKPVDLNVAVLEVAQLLKPMLAEDVRVEVRLKDDLPPVMGGLGPFQQVIMNLCLNAADAMPDGGRLGLSTGSTYLHDELTSDQQPLRPGHYVRLNVTDTGVGISEDHLAQIFEPFFTTKGSERGTGLGLAVVYEIVKRHGGAIRVNSTLGRGSDFALYLPVVDAVQDKKTGPVTG